MRHKSKKMIPSWKSFSQVTLLDAASDGVNDDDIIHHDDDPGQTTDDEDDGNHDQNKRQSLLTFTDDFVSHSDIFVLGFGLVIE